MKIENPLNTLAPREKNLVILGGVFVTIFLIYVLAFKPFLDHVSSLNQKLQDQKYLLSWMEISSVELQKSKATGSLEREAIGDASLLSIIDKSIQQGAIANYEAELEQKSENQVRVRFNSVSFSDLIIWLQSIWQRYGIEPNQVNFIQQEEPGVVQADITLVSP